MFVDLGSLGVTMATNVLIITTYVMGGPIALTVVMSGVGIAVRIILS